MWLMSVPENRFSAFFMEYLGKVPKCPVMCLSPMIFSVLSLLFLSTADEFSGGYKSHSFDLFLDD